jgi:hypothetical protein
MPAVATSLTIEEWAVTCSPPDDDGNVTFTAKVSADYRGSASAHLARLSWVLFDPSGSIPLLQGDNTLNQDIDDEDTVEVEAGGYGKLGDRVEPDACQVKGQLVCYLGEKQPPWTIPLPEGGQTGGKGPVWPHAGAEVTGWRLTCSEGSDESASYSLFILVRNTGTLPLAAVTFRVRVRNRKGDVWSTEHLAVERLASGEMRAVETTLYVSERAKARKGALIEIVAIACRQAYVESLPVAAVAVQSAGVKRYFYGNMKWFEPAEQPRDIRSLPPEFARAKALWDVDAEGNHNDIVALLSTYVTATFIPQNVDQASDLFADVESEVSALAARIVGVDFSKGPIPMVKAEAVFEVDVVSGFDSADLESRNLHDALSFRWEVGRDADTADLDFSHGDHQGAECIPVDEPPFLGGIATPGPGIRQPPKGLEPPSQREILARAVNEFRRNPRNKLIFDCATLLAWSREELGRSPSALELRRALHSFQTGEATEADERLVDAATSLCHQAADQCFGESDAGGEFEEVDINTDWNGLDEADPGALFVVVRPA